jgi:spermidine synthase
LSSGVLLIPAVLMGATLPILSAWLVRRVELTGFKAGRLYSVNTMGAMVGAGLSGFYLIRLIGVHNTFYVAIALNLIIAGLSFVLSFRDRTIREPPARVAAAPGSAHRVPSQAVLAGLLFMSGFVGLGYEIVWMRTVVHILGGETYVFSAILCAYLLGYAVGVDWGSRLTRRAMNHFAVFGVTFQLVGLCGLLYLPLLVNTMDPRVLMFVRVFRYLSNQEGYFLHLLVSFVFFFIPSLLMGIGFPLLVQMRSEAGPAPGNTVARAYGINTIGCVLGALAAGFVLIPFLGAQVSVQLLGGTAVLCGLLAIPFFQTQWKKVVPVVLAVCAVFAVVIFPMDGFVVWINVCETRGTRRVALIEAIEGINTTASVHYYPDLNAKVISTAGINVAGDTPNLRQTQKVQGHVPLILHGHPRKVLTVGFGSGELTKILTFHDLAHITCVEIAPEMVALAKKHFPHINLGDRLEEKVRMVYMDAKNYVHLADDRYDVILNDCTWPGEAAESSSLYTKEYFQDGKKLLNEGGVYSTWLPINMPTRSLRSIIRTFDAVFENTVMVYPHYSPSQHILLVGQKKSHKYSYVDMRNEYGKCDVARSLEMLGIRSINDIIDFILVDSDSLAALAGDYPVNSDDFPVVEFDIGRRRSRTFTWEQLKAILGNTRRVDFSRLFSFDGLDYLSRQEVLTELVRSQRANEHLFNSYLAGRTVEHPQATLDELLGELQKGLDIDPGNPDILRASQRFIDLAHRRARF